MNRTFYPGQEWVYFKIYMNSENSDMVLSDYIYPYICRNTRSGYISEWFFIRYGDPLYHLRVRVKVSYLQFVGVIISEMYDTIKRLTASHIITKIVIDTYDREIERYAPWDMEECEHFFCSDSNLACKILRDKAIAYDNCWIVGAVFIMTMLDNCFSVMDEKIDFIKERAISYEIEFGLTGSNLKQFNDIYRKYKPIYEKIVDSTGDNKLIGHIRNIVTGNYDSARQSMLKVLPSLIHMHFNRLFPTGQRLSECAAYILLEKALKSKMAREKATL